MVVAMRLIPSSTHGLRDTLLLDESDGRPLYTISTSRFGGTTTIERTKGDEIDHGESVATIDFNLVRSDRITLKDVDRKRDLEMKVGSEYLVKPSGASDFTRQRNFCTSSGQAYEWRPDEDDWQLCLPGDGPAVARWSVPRKDWSTGETKPAGLEIADSVQVLEDLDEIVTTFVYVQLRQEKDMKSSATVQNMGPSSGISATGVASVGGGAMDGGWGPT